MRVKYVSDDELQRIFNEGRYYERMLAGEFHAHMIGQKRYKRGDRRVRNTMSQTVEYRDEFGRFIARVHQFRRRDGSLGASGKPDPKALYHDGVLYLLDMTEDWDIEPWYDDET
jgi:hypothetical protein